MKKMQKILNAKNTNKKLIDLIVPCYKAKDTLTRLLLSVAIQTMKNNIHIILVQDCDEEDYSKIITQFSQCLDIQIIQMEKNSGPGTCRRIGMKAGKCKYIICMDADDTFQNPFAVEELYASIEEHNLDAVNSVFIEQLADLQFYAHNNNDWVWMFGKIYRRKFLEKNKIEMNDSRANEDTGFNSVVRCVGKIGFLPDTTYIWYSKEDSITRIDGGIYRFTGIEGWLYNMEWAINHMIRLKAEEKNIQQFVAENIIATYTWFLEFGRDSDPRVNVEEYKKWVHKYYKNIYIKYQPTEDQLNAAFQGQIGNYHLSGIIPKYTFEQYLNMIGEEYNGK
jgi:glycosyltransferase involved in cell wall biosynthesis